ncbi:oxygenase MpaB family protein [Nocardioides caeni]|uniref:DUF2236 domain-containing protein n=2 Tax=Nocardioides caeni TaxID=574700 RepID=A0A4S8N451_9ACTN|nr:DUF2236 domain-containing protein [Nocardioides caeni]
MDTSVLVQGVNAFVLLGGAANVIMQLANAPVGHGVMESRVDEGNLFKNPRRRMRTTAAYLAVALHGTAEERAAMRRATNSSHAQVRSEPGAPVAYNAFDPALQKWVAACLYKGVEDAYVLAHGPLPADIAEDFLQQGKVFGTTLQMDADAWPATRADFEEYWTTTTAGLAIDDRTREFLLRVVNLDYLDARIPAKVRRFRVWSTSGYLGPDFRRLMDLPWTEEDQARFDRFNRRTARIVRSLPAAARQLPVRGHLRDVRRRMARGEPLF